MSVLEMDSNESIISSDRKNVPATSQVPTTCTFSTVNSYEGKDQVLLVASKAGSYQKFIKTFGNGLLLRSATSGYDHPKCR